MDFGLTDRHEKYRDEVRHELRGAAVQAALADVPVGDIGGPELRRLYRVLGERGLLAPHWPAEYGGQGRTFAEGIIVAEELVRSGIPDTLHISTIQIVGQFLLLIGTPEQKRRYLPGMARGDDYVSVLFTEPESGSDQRDEGVQPQGAARRLCPVRGADHARRQQVQRHQPVHDRHDRTRHQGDPHSQHLRRTVLPGGAGPGQGRPGRAARRGGRRLGAAE
jgi:hypothetical protein